VQRKQAPDVHRCAQRRMPRGPALRAPAAEKWARRTPRPAPRAPPKKWRRSLHVVLPDPTMRG